METIKGKVRADPELSFTQTGVQITKFKLYSDDAEGEGANDKKIIAWNELACLANDLLFPDQEIYVKGYWKERNWEQYTIKEFTAQGIWIVKDGKPIDITKYIDSIVKFCCFYCINRDKLGCKACCNSINGKAFFELCKADNICTIENDECIQEKINHISCFKEI